MYKIDILFFCEYNLEPWIYVRNPFYLFLFYSTQCTASECTFVTLLAARSEAIRKYKVDNKDDELDDAEINARLVAYCSDQVK